MDVDVWVDDPGAEFEVCQWGGGVRVDVVNKGWRLNIQFPGWREARQFAAAMSKAVKAQYLRERRVRRTA